MKGLSLGLLVAWLLPGQACAAWLALCTDDAVPPEARVMAIYPDEDGAMRQLLATDKEPQRCASAMLDADVAQMRWASLINRADLPRISAGLSLLGRETGDALAISEIIPAQARPAPAQGLRSVALGQDLIELYQTRAFGIEERAALIRDKGSLRLECSAGDAPAGLLLLGTGDQLARDVRLELKLRTTASGAFRVGFSDADRMLEETPMIIGAVAANPRPSSSLMEMPAAVTSGEHAFSILCPADAASLDLLGMQLIPAPGLELPGRATWVWQATLWIDTPESLLEQLIEFGADTAFISVPLDGGSLAVTVADRLTQFIVSAGERGIAVWAVEGDPHAVLPHGLASMRLRAKALRNFNAERPPGQRLAGVQYDIEPYLLASFELDPSAWLRRYLETIAVLRATVDMPLEVAVPFWWSSLAVDGSPMLEHMTPLVDGITVMNYRTEPGEIRDAAMQFLFWGADQRRHVRIALEAGPLPDQTRWHYRPFPLGRLWQIDIGDNSALVLLDKPQPNDAGAAYALSYAVEVPADRTTFRGRRPALQPLIAELENLWAAWPSFAGIAVHEYLQPTTVD